jgi:hypothetical protein
MGGGFGLSIGQAIEIAKTLADLVKRGATVELQEKIVELREALVEAKEELLSLREENLELNAEIDRKASMTFEDGVYWLTDGSNGRTGPFCQRCYDVDRKSIRLQDFPADTHTSRYRSCTACGRNYFY